MARSPERVVASPYVGRKNGSIVIMKMPKPKPVVRCTKLAPMLNRNMAITTLLIFFPFSPCFQMADDGIRSAYTIITGKLDGVVTSDIPKLCPDIQAVVFVGQTSSGVEYS